MDSYEGFAEMYDALMADTPYENWAAYIDGALYEWFKDVKRENFASVAEEKNQSNNRDNITVLDLACGTGSITLRLAEMGYDMIGVDISEDMLAQAQMKTSQFATNLFKKILFLKQDVRKLDLYGTVDAAVCVCDGLNYILTDEDLLEVFKRVRLFLNPGGIFIFDMNTEYKFNEMFGGQIFEGRGDNGEAYEWENVYDAATRINEYRVTFFSLENDGTVPFEETHRQRAYPPADVCNMLSEAGFATVATRDGYTSQPLHAQSERVVYIVGG